MKTATDGKTHDKDDDGATAYQEGYTIDGEGNSGIDGDTGGGGDHDEREVDDGEDEDEDDSGEGEEEEEEEEEKGTKGFQT